MKRTITAARLQQLRKKAGITQKEAAEKIGCADVASYESGNRKPKNETLVRLAQFYGVTTDYLLGASEFETPEHIAAGAAIPLTTEALNYLQTCEKSRLAIISTILSIPSTNDLIDAVGNYIEDSEARDSNGEIKEKYADLREIEAMREVTDERLESFAKSYAIHCFEKEFQKAAKEIRDTMETETENAGPRLGRPKKYKTKKGANT